MSFYPSLRGQRFRRACRLTLACAIGGLLLLMSTSISASDADADDSNRRNPALTEPQNGVASLSSDSDRLGLGTSAPFTTVNEFTGKLNIALDPIGVPGMYLQPIYKSPQEKYCDDESGFRLCPMNEAPTGQGLGFGWRFNFGYILARNAVFGNGTGPASADWERVRFVDTAGNVTVFGRTTYRYQDAAFPFATEVRRWRHATESERDTFTYYQAGANRGLPFQETRGESGAPTSFHDYVFGMQTRMDHPEGVDTIRTLNPDGSVATETVDGVTTTYHYDEDGRVVLVQRPDTADLVTEYGRPGATAPYITSYYRLQAPEHERSGMAFPIVTRTKSGYTIPVLFRQFDVWGRETRESIATLDRITFERDTTYTPLGLVAQKTSGLGGHWSYEYDAFGRPTRIFFTWTEANRILQDTLFGYRRTVDGHAILSQRVSAYDTDSTLERVQETDFLGRITMAGTNGSSTFFQYTAHPKGLKTTVLPLGDAELARTTIRTWLGQVIEETHPEIGEPIRYAYDSRGFLAHRYQGNESNPTAATRFVYDGLGRVRETYGRLLNEPNESLLSTFAYDARNRLTEAVQVSDEGLPVT